MNKLDMFLGQLLMLEMGHKGNTLAHIFLERKARYPLTKATDAEFQHDTKCFIPPKSEDRILMFEDNSGVYVHADGLCTIMGSDISREVVVLDEV